MLPCKVAAQFDCPHCQDFPLLTLTFFVQCKWLHTGGTGCEPETGIYEATSAPSETNAGVQAKNGVALLAAC